ncbi:MAG: Gmad2 immunoglobulin-like domain-containing protein [Candidatus Nomurabacteria bacterium]|nr:Gmad2 immunoglobulin-like domain-containing protein [Candidatus Nomurabacteria bacterium]
MKFVQFIFFALVAGLIVYFIVVAAQNPGNQKPYDQIKDRKSTSTPIWDIENSTFSLSDFDDASAELSDGVGSFETGGIIPGTVIIEGDFGSSLGQDRYIVIMTINSGGTGAFSYAGLFKNPNDIVLSDMEFLGDRIIVDDLLVAKGKYLFDTTILVEIKNRKPDEAFASVPTVSETIILGVDGDQLVQIDDNPEKTISEYADMIIVDNPNPYEIITSPLSISGRARGTWFFEGDSPVSLVDWDGVEIATGYITAQGDWMTSEFVDFSGTLTFTDPNVPYNNGTLILMRDNPSDLPENDDAIEIPIRFAF